MNKKIKFFSIISVCFVLFSCASSTQKKPVQKNPDAVTISVLPFSTSVGVVGDGTERALAAISLAEIFMHGNSWTGDEADVVDYYEAFISSVIDGVKQFILVDLSDVKNALDSKTEIPCQFYVIGTMTEFDSDYTKEKYTETLYRKTISGTMVLELIEAKTGKVFVSKTYEFDEESGQESNKFFLPTAEELLEDVISDSSVDFLVAIHNKIESMK